MDYQQAAVSRYGARSFVDQSASRREHRLEAALSSWVRETLHGNAPGDLVADGKREGGGISGRPGRTGNVFLERNDANRAPIAQLASVCSEDQAVGTSCVLREGATGVSRCMERL